MIDIDRLLSLYEDGIGTTELSRIFGVHRATIQRKLKANGVELRKTSPHKSYKINFFSEYTRESCYWAGFIAADGYVRPNRNTLEIKLAKIDREHLCKFASEIGFQREVKDYYNYSTINVNGKWFVSDLVSKFGIGNKKTFTIELPNIPDEYLSHFIRGYFDGDGCVTFTTCPQISFTSGSLKLTAQIREVLHSKLPIKLKSGNLVAPITHPQETTNVISYSGKNAKLILDWLYTDSDRSLRLDRKYDKYIELFC